MTTHTSSATFRYEGTPPQTRLPLIVGALASIALHAVLILGFSEKAAKPQAAIVDDGPLILMEMPVIPPDEEDKVEELTDIDQPEMPTVQVPMLQDIPINVPTVDSFTQLVDLNIPAQLADNANKLVAIPTNIRHGNRGDFKMKNLFNVGDLDRQPEAIYRIAPQMPYDVKQVYSKARCKVGFIITAGGDVVQAYVISSDHRSLEAPTLAAVAKWRFKPGVKGGKKVNTRVEQAVDYTVEKEG